MRNPRIAIELSKYLCLAQPYIVKAYNLILAEDVTLPPWIIIEYIPLNLLEALINLAEKDRPIVLTHLSSALYYMYALGITYRDVKLKNTLVQKLNRKLIIKLADFGTSKYNVGVKMDTFTGTKIYMAPELFKKPRHYTNKVDIWSLGLIGMQLFTIWDPVLDIESNLNNFGTWMRNVILPHMVEAPEQFRPLLSGLLCKNPLRK